MQVSVVAVHFVESMVCVGIMSKNQTEDFSILRSVNPIIFINSDKSLPDMLRMQDVVNVTSPPDGAFRVVASQEGWVINTVQVDRSEELRPGDFIKFEFICEVALPISTVFSDKFRPMLVAVLLVQ